MFSNLFHKDFYTLARLLSENGVLLFWENRYVWSTLLETRKQNKNVNLSVLPSTRALSFSVKNSIGVIFIVVFAFLLTSCLVLILELLKKHGKC